MLDITPCINDLLLLFMDRQIILQVVWDTLYNTYLYTKRILRCEIILVDYRLQTYFSNL